MVVDRPYCVPKCISVRYGGALIKVEKLNQRTGVLTCKWLSFMMSRTLEDADRSWSHVGVAHALLSCTSNVITDVDLERDL